jgi:hypothetical protein
VIIVQVKHSAKTAAEKEDNSNSRTRLAIARIIRAVGGLLRVQDTVDMSDSEMLSLQQQFLGPKM